MRSRTSKRLRTSKRVRSNRMNRHRSKAKKSHKYTSRKRTKKKSKRSNKDGAKARKVDILPTILELESTPLYRILKSINYSDDIIMMVNNVIPPQYTDTEEKVYKYLFFIKNIIYVLDNLNKFHHIKDENIVDDLVKFFNDNKTIVSIGSGTGETEDLLKKKGKSVVCVDNININDIKKDLYRLCMRVFMSVKDHILLNDLFDNLDTASVAIEKFKKDISNPEGKLTVFESKFINNLATKIYYNMVSKCYPEFKTADAVKNARLEDIHMYIGHPYPYDEEKDKYDLQAIKKLKPEKLAILFYERGDSNPDDDGKLFNENYKLVVVKKYDFDYEGEINRFQINFYEKRYSGFKKQMDFFGSES